MQVNLTHHSPTRKSIEVTVPASEVSAAFGEVIARLAPKVKIPGFRPGKAPKDVLISRYDREIQAEVAEALVKRHFFAAAQAAGTQPVSQPALEPAELKDGQDAKLRAHYDVAPEVQLPDYKGLELYDPRCSGEHFGVLAVCASGRERELMDFFRKKGGEVRVFS